MPHFVAGITLNRRFFQEVVRPILDITYPGLHYAAALIGPGSETLSFDTEMSMDHDWGYHFSIFLKDIDIGLVDDMANLLSHKLPPTYRDFAVSLPPTSKSPVFLTKERCLAGPIKHHIAVCTVRNFLQLQIGYDLVKPLRPVEWLTIPPHALGEVVAGEVFHDGTGELTATRDALSWYPHDVWLYIMASGWQRIGQEEHLMPRAGYVGDELGSSLIGSRLVRDIMNLCFLMEKQYAPYAKWFGTAFQQLACAPELTPLLGRVQQASSWRERELALTGAYEILAGMYNAMGICQKLPTCTSAFYDRPFNVIHGEIFAGALIDQIADPETRDISSRPLIGNVSQWSDSTEIEAVEKVRLIGLYQ